LYFYNAVARVKVIKEINFITLKIMLMSKKTNNVF